MSFVPQPIPLSEPELRIVEVKDALVGIDEDPNKHLGLVRKIALKYFSGPGPIEDSDAYSDGCLGLLEAVKTYNREIGAFSTWAWKLIGRFVIDGYRKRSRQVRIPLVRMSDLSSAASETIVCQEPPRELGDLISSIPDMLEPHPEDSEKDKRNKRILEMHFLEGKTLAEIGVEVGITTSGVCLARKRGLELLRIRFSDLVE
jgi:RNA polymerase sigma factor (sigma-70 family)